MGRGTEREEHLLKEIYPTTDNPTLSKILGRSVSAIENKASRMGLKKKDNRARAGLSLNSSARAEGHLMM